MQRSRKKTTRKNKEKQSKAMSQGRSGWICPCFTFWQLTGKEWEMMKQFRKNMMICLGIAALTASVLLAGCSTQKEADISDRQETKIGSEEAESSIAVPEATDYTEDTDVAESTESGENSENASEKLSLPVLDEIDSKVQIGTSGSSLIAVQAAVKLLEWGEHTGLDPEEIREAASAWLSEQTDSDREEALLKLEMVDDAYQRLLKEDARELLDTAGCADTEIFWGSEPVEPVEAIMQAAGLRKD